MDVDYSNESSCDSSEISELSSSEELNVGRDVNTIQPYAFEPVETDSASGGEDSGSEEMVSVSSSNSENTRLQDTNW